MTTVTRGKKYDLDVAALGGAFERLGAQSGALTDPFSELVRELGAEPYRYPIPFACSKECGGPIRLGDLFVQTSPDWKPLRRAHAACVAGRKGLEGSTPDEVVREVADRLLDKLGAAR